MQGFLKRLAGMARASPGEVGLIALIGLIIVAGSALVLVRTTDTPAPEIKRISKPAEKPKAPAKVLVVHVAGMVASPGVYELSDGSRVKDAIAAAGGAAPGADLDALNLAARVSDGQKVMVTKPGGPSPSTSGEGGQPASAQSAGPAEKVSLNVVTPAQLEELPAVGPVIAQRIVEFRQKKGGFTGIRQLLDVEGIGPKKFEGLKDLVQL